MDQRVAFIGAWLTGRYTKSALCRHFGVSRPTGDKWIVRYEREGLAGLNERSSAPRAHPNATPARVCERIVEVKGHRQHWGPKKVLDYLRRTEPEQRWPADSTAGEILRRAGWVQPRRRRQGVPAHEPVLDEPSAPNALWAADFKGDFRLGIGRRCYPLTLSDGCSRYLLGCRGLARIATAETRPWFERAFREYGLPWAIRTDNGSPFASKALGGLSALSKWWIDLGIRPERIRPGRPQQNGCHERMHRSLKDAIGPPARDFAEQQQRLDAFIHEYNWERSHESLDRQTPGSLYTPSQRPYPTRIRPPSYSESATVRRVRTNGEIKWRGGLLYLSEALCGEPIALEPCADGVLAIYYRFHRLGELDERTGNIASASRWHHQHNV